VVSPEIIKHKKTTTFTDSTFVSLELVVYFYLLFNK
jgi:hypothetical protein